MTQLPQVLPEDAPPWTFWLETNSAFGYITSKEAWEAARANYSDCGLERFRAAAWHHPSMLGTGAKLEANFGLRREHTGEKTLADWAKEHNLDWLK